MMLAGFVLQASGFVPKAEQTELAKSAMIGFMALFPFVTYGIAAVVLSVITSYSIHYTKLYEDCWPWPC